MVTCFPLIEIWPLSQGISPSMIFNSVVLPQPLGPMMLTNSLARTDRFTSMSAFTSVVLSLTVF